MEDTESFLIALIQRTPLPDVLCQEIIQNNFFQPILEPGRRCTQYLKARRLYDEIFYRSLNFSTQQLENLKQIFFDTGNGCAGELLFSNRPQLCSDSLKFFEKRMPSLQSKLPRRPSLITSKENRRERDTPFFQAAITGNAGKLESFLLLWRVLDTLSTPSFMELTNEDAQGEERGMESFVKNRKIAFRTKMISVLIGKRDWAQRTLLHSAIYSKCGSLSSCVNVILEYAQTAGIKAAVLDCKDCFGNTPLHLSIRRRNVQMTRKLILEGADIFLMDNRSNCPLQLIYQLLPKAGTCLMDMAITVSGDISCDTPSLNIDFGTITSFLHFPKALDAIHQVYKPNQNELKQNAGRKASSLSSLIKEGVDRILDVENEPTDRTTAEIQPEELRNLAYLLHNDKKACWYLSAHPVAKLFLHLKWNRLKGRFYIQIVAKILFWLLYFLVVVQIYFVDCPSRAEQHQAHRHETSSNTTNTFKDKSDGKCTWSYFTLLLVPPTLLFAILQFYSPAWRLITTIPEFKRGRFGYPYLGNSVHVLFLCFVPVTVVPPYFQSTLTSYQYLLAVIGVLLGSVRLLHVLGESNSDCEIQSIYVYVYMRVLWRFLSVIITFSFAFLGFAISFSIIFSEPNKFSTFVRQTFRLFIMIHGEFDFEETTLKSHFDEGDYVFWTGQLLFVLFGSLITLVLIDVFLGYTVSDIKELRDRAEDKRRFIQIEQMFLLEKSIISWDAGLGGWLAAKLKLKQTPWLQVGDICVIKEQNRNRNRNDYVVGLEELPSSLQADFRRFLFSEG